MEQYGQSDQDATNSAPRVSHTLQAQVLPQVVELKWENKVLQVPNPAYVRELHLQQEKMRQDIQEIKDKYQRLQNNHAQLLRTVQQLQNQLQG